MHQGRRVAPLLLAGGCLADLLPGETVVGVEVAAETWDGQADDRFGAVVAGSGASWAATAPGRGAWARDGGWFEEDVVFVGFLDGELARATADGSWTWGERAGRVEGARRWALGGAGLWAASADSLVRAEDGFRVEAPGVGALAVGSQRVLAARCAPGCVAEAWTSAGEPLGAWAEVGEEGAVGEWGGVAWAGDPEAAVDDGAGRVCAEDGRCLAGATGDHLGGAFGGGFAVGRFNRWVVPARTRLVPLEGGEVYALETGAEDQPVALGGDGSAVVVGQPSHEVGGVPAGVVTVFTP